MKKLVALLFFNILIISTYAQTNEAKKIIGVWLSEEKDGKVEIYEKNGKYFGKVVYSRDNPNALDDNNPNPKLQSRKVVGLEILKDFTYDGDLVWEDGEIYDPNTGKTYSCKMTLDRNNKTLNIRGYVGISLLGRTTVWTRTTK